jgi:NADH-quinone oxidoreductase subunit H
MNPVVALIVAIALYPGVIASLAAAWVLAWTREAARAALGSGQRPGPLRALSELRSLFGRDPLQPEGVYAPALALAAAVALAMPLVALVLLPVPGNPLVRALGLTGDLAVGGGLLLGLPFMRLLVGWVVPSPYARLAADRGARLLAGCALPMMLALIAMAQQVGTFQLTGADATSRTSLPLVALAARVLAAAAFACCLPVLARATALREGDQEIDIVAGELSELNGRELAIFRVAEAVQLVAVAGFFVAAFILPVLVTFPASQRFIVWIVVLLVTAAGIGAWEGTRGGQASASTEKPPLSWWFGLPLVLSLFALVLAAWAARGG